MRTSAQVLFAVAVFLYASLFFHNPAYAQTVQSSPIIASSLDSTNNFLTPNTDPDVPENHHTYTQVVLIDMLSAVSCSLTGSDPTDPNTPCLSVNPTTGKIGLSQTVQTQQFGQLPNQYQAQGLLGVMTNYVADLYVPTVSSSEYVDYLAGDFGIVKKVDAATPASTAGCTNTFGYGFCGLSPIFALWTGMRDFAYMLLTVLFIVIGIGVMLRFKVDPRTVMTLQNQIPRVIISIILITFSYAISGIMVDLMWTTTYAGINFISSASPDSQICLTKSSQPEPLAQGIDQQLVDNPLSFLNTLFKGPNIANGADNCQTEGLDSGVVHLATNISASFGVLINQILEDLFHIQGGCGFSLNPFNDLACIAKSAFGTALLWITEQIVTLIVIVAILISLFRLWFQLIKAYVTFLIFVILGPLWIVFGLVPGRPLGFEKWLRIIFANLAAFPVVAFMLVFARVLVDTGEHPGVLGAATTASANAQVLAAGTVNQAITSFPLVANTSVSHYLAFAALAILLILPTIPDLIKNNMKATGQGKYGATVAAGLGFAAGAATSPGKKVWDNLNRVNHTTGAPEGSLAILKQRAWQKTPVLGRRAVKNKLIGHEMAAGATYQEAKDKATARMTPAQPAGATPSASAGAASTQSAGTQPGRTRRFINKITGRAQPPETTEGGPQASAATFGLDGPLKGKPIPNMGETMPLPAVTPGKRKGVLRSAAAGVAGAIGSAVRQRPSPELRSPEFMEGLMGTQSSTPSTPGTGNGGIRPEGTTDEATTRIKEATPSGPWFMRWIKKPRWGNGSASATRRGSDETKKSKER